MAIIITGWGQGANGGDNVQLGGTMFEDNRKFIEALERTGDVVRVRQEVDWDLEVGAIIRRANEKRQPAALFEKIKDYPAGYRIFGSPLGTYRRVASQDKTVVGKHSSGLVKPELRIAAVARGQFIPVK